MIPAIVERVSTITEKGQTTVPKAVRDALGLEYGGRVVFRVDATGVSVRRADGPEDPVLGAFLQFLARNMQQHPEEVAELAPALAERLAALVRDVELDPTDDIEGEVSI